MQTKWRDLIVVDYEVDFPTASSYELGLYSSGLQLFPKVALGVDRVWGRARRAGLVEIPVLDYETVLQEFAADCLTSQFICRMSTTLAYLTRSLHQACGKLEQNLLLGHPVIADQLESITDSLSYLVSFHVLNWILPLDKIISRLELLLGTRAAAREALLGLIVPFTSSHVLDAFNASELPDRNALAHSKRQGRIAHRTLCIWLRSRGDPNDLTFLTNLARLGRLVAEEEEERRRIQNRWMSIADMLPAEFFKDKTSQSEPLTTLAYNGHGWDWLK